MTENKKQYGLQVLGAIRVFRKDKEITGKGKKTFNITDVWLQEQVISDVLPSWSLTGRR